MKVTSSILLTLWLAISAETKTDYSRRLGLAQEHYERVYQKIGCFSPQARVVLMDTPQTRFVPPATILHRCGDSTGCCRSLSQTCAVKKEEEVTLFFYVKQRRDTSRVGLPTLRRFVFSNHTQCHCVERI